MKSFSNRFSRTISLLFVTFAALAMGSCVMVADNTLGSDIMPESQVMVMRHLKYQGNTRITFDAETGKTETALDNLIETRLYSTDSLISSNLTVGYMGVRRSDIFGQRTAGFASTMLYMNAIDEDNGFGYMPIFDTMKLILTVNNYGGDTLVPIKYQVFELKKSLAKNALVNVLTNEDDDVDSVAYMNIDLAALDLYDPSKPIFEFTFPDSEKGEGPATLMIPMKNTEYSWDFVRRLMLIPEDYATNAEWDGYGRSDIEIYSNDEKWLENFHGLYIKPVEELPANKEGGLYSLDLTASGIMLQGRSRNPKDPSMIKDTVGMYYYFCDESSAYNTSVTKISRDYTQGKTSTPILNEGMLRGENRPTVSTCYVEGLGGVATEIYFTDAFLDELLSLETSGGAAYSKMGINQCMLSIYVKGAEYDWDKTQSSGNAADLALIYDTSFARFGTYHIYDRYYDTRYAATDYNYLYEESYGTMDVYNGYLDRSRGCYTINLTAYMQELYNCAKSAKQEDGTYLFPSPYGIDGKGKGYVSRTIYVGAEASNMFSFTESTLQGMPEDENGNKVSAPIQIDLTYTLIK